MISGQPHRWIKSLTVVPSTQNRHPLVASSFAPGWRPAVLLIGVAGLVFGAVFRDEVTRAVDVWIDSTAYNHCFLILPLAAFLLWERRGLFNSVSPQPTLWPLLLMPLLSTIWLVAAALDIQEGRQLVMVAMFEVIILVALGPVAYRLLLAPLMFLFFLVPSGAFLVPSLQRITANITILGLHALHIPVYSDGYMIEIPEGSFEIAEACAGLRFLIASTVFGCFFAVLMYRSLLRRAIFVIMSVAVPIVANGLRALGIIVLAHLEGNAAAVEADHVVYGWVFFTLVIFTLIGLGMTFAQRASRPLPTTFRAVHKALFWRFAVAVPAAVLLALAGPAYAHRLDNLYPAVPFPLVDSPQVGAPWRMLAGSAPEWRPLVHGADREFIESFEEPGSGVVIRYLGLYRLRAIGNSLTTTENRFADGSEWRIAKEGHAEMTINGREVRANSAEIIAGRHRRLVWSFYVVDGTITAEVFEAKLLQARAVVFERSPLAALVAVSASMDDPGNPAERQLGRFLEASQPFADYFEALPR
jgi:exosortase A